MLDRSFIEEQVNKMIEEKGYDRRAKAMQVAFYTSLATRYDFTEEQFLEAIERYKSTVKSISFYNIGASNYMYTSDGDLVFDKETAENLDETNIERFIQASIKGNTMALFGQDKKNCKNITELAALVNMYEDKGDIDSSIVDMLAGGFDIDTGSVISVGEDVFKGMVESQENGDTPGYNYYNTSRILVFNIEDKLEELRKGHNVKDAYKAIYALSLLNLKIKVKEGLVTNETAEHYAQLVNTFRSRMKELGITESELSSISADKSNWKINTNELIEEIEGVIQMPELAEKEQKQGASLDRQGLIQMQKEEVGPRSIPTVADIENRVAKLMEEKKYPEEVRGLLTEFFTRHTQDFEWDTETLDKKIGNLRANVDSFVYCGKDVLDGAAGRYNGVGKKIELLDKNALTSKLELASTLMHELKHATDSARLGHTEVEHSFHTRIKVHGIEISGLDELVTEGATLMIKGKNPYNDKYATTYRYPNGYSEFTGTLSMLSSALGMSESEFLKLATKGEDKTKEELEARYPGLNFGRKLDEIQDSLTMVNHVALHKGLAAEAYADIYNAINYIYENRVAVDRQKPGFDEVRARYDEYRLNKNLLNARRNLGFSKKVLAEKIPGFDEVKSKARIRPEERADFESIGQEIRGQIQLRDNRNLVRCGADVKRYKRHFAKDNIFTRLLPKPKEKQSLLPESTNPAVERMKKEQEAWLEGIHYEVPNQQQVGQSMQTGEPDRRPEQSKDDDITL